MLKTGDLVEVTLFGGGIQAMKVLEHCGNTVYVATTKEWDMAVSEGREPAVVGFNIRYVRVAA